MHCLTTILRRCLIHGLSLIFVQSLLQAQTAPMAIGMGSTSSDEGKAVAKDAAGNVYVTGYFRGIADFDPGPNSFFLTSQGGDNIFVAKYDPSGNFLWAQRFGNNSPNIYDNVGNGIAVDNATNVLVTGYFSGTVDFDPGPGVANLTAVTAGNAACSDIFVLKLNANGNYAWAKRLGGGYYDYGNAITVDGSGNVFTTGGYLGVGDFDPGPGTVNLPSADPSGTFISKLDPNGNYLWAGAIGGNGTWGSGITIDASGNILTVGLFNGTGDFDPGAGTVNLTSAGVSDAFVSKLNNNGNFIWARRLGGTGYDWGFKITTDNSGNVLTTGYFDQTADFDPGAGTFNLSSMGAFDGFVSKLNSAGNFVWAKRMGGPAFDVGSGIACDGSNRVWVLGQFAAVADFGSSNLSSVNGTSDIFISKWDANGSFLGVNAIAGGGEEACTDVTISPSGDVIATGYFSGGADFDPGTNTLYPQHIGGKDVFVTRFSLGAATSNSFLPGSEPLLFSLPLADFDGDGYDDVLIQKKTALSILARNVPNTNFTSQPFASLLNKKEKVIAANDISGDGRPEIILRQGRNIKVVTVTTNLHITNSSFSLPTFPVGFKVIATSRIETNGVIVGGKGRRVILSAHSLTGTYTNSPGFKVLGLGFNGMSNVLTLFLKKGRSLQMKSVFVSSNAITFGAIQNNGTLPKGFKVRGLGFILHTNQTDILIQKGKKTLNALSGEHYQSNDFVSAIEKGQKVVGPK